GPPCRVDMQKDLPRPNQTQPLYLYPGTDRYWLPNSRGYLEIARGDIIELHCSPFSFEFLPAEVQSIKMRCLQGTTFEWSERIMKFSDIVCSQSIPYVVERLSTRCGNVEISQSRATSFLYRVGYPLADGRFVTTMELCHNPLTLRTHYAQYEQSPASVHFQRNVKRLPFSAAGHFQGYDMAILYTQRHQQQVLAYTGLLEVENPSFLSRGHLAAKADLIFASQQRSTFNYVNVAPQWQSFNGGQWANLEDSTRRFLAKSGISVTAYTGVYGDLRVGANGTTLHLATDENNNGVLAVPQLFYRVLIDYGDPARGIALVGVNYPWATLANVEASFLICGRVESQVNWLHWMLKGNAKGNLWKGYLYACSVADFARVVTQLPRSLLKVDKLLK
ncbi:hypothetical protein KR018_012099, partial [Drosophila ironensis]